MPRRVGCAGAERTFEVLPFISRGNRARLLASAAVGQSVAGGTRTSASDSEARSSWAVHVIVSVRPDFSPCVWTSVVPSANVSVPPCDQVVVVVDPGRRSGGGVHDDRRAVVTVEAVIADEPGPGRRVGQRPGGGGERTGGDDCEE